jgi:glycosyltransferase involved in cell wall biosynthesis
MRIGLIAPPFIAVPPAAYGGTELFIANLATELHALGHEVTVYANGESRLPCRVKWLYPTTDWPVDNAKRTEIKNMDHLAWAMRDAAGAVDVIHLNDGPGAALTRLVDMPAVLTIHHPHDSTMAAHYAKYPRIEYVAIARWLARREAMPNVHVIHHGVPLDAYTFSSMKHDFALFLGRMHPDKGPHLAIEVAQRAGASLKLAGEIQPVAREYWNREIAPRVDGRQIEYVGQVDHAAKNALLSSARALLFPIQWEEPFGLVMIEAMACGTPVLALRGGAVEEIVRDGVNGWICRDVPDLADHLASGLPKAAACRDFVAEHFSARRMAKDYLDVYDRGLRATTART